MLTEHLAVIEEELTSFAGHLENERDGWKEGSDAYKRYCARLERIDAALVAVRQEREAGTWQPFPDGKYERPNWNGNGTVTLSVLHNGEEIEQWHSSNINDAEEISFAPDMRLCRRIQSSASQQATPATD